MRLLGVALMGATGVVLLASGLSVGGRLRLAQRVDPYVGRADRLWGEPRVPAGGSVVTRLWSRLGSSDRHLMNRLKAARSSLDPPGFRMQQLVWGALGLAFVLVVVLAAGRVGLRVEAGGLVLLGGIAFASGVCGRDWFLSREIMFRARRTTEELPVAIDLMTLTLMAGGSVPIACERVADTFPDGVGRELADALEEMRGGRSATEALRDVARKVDHPPLARLIEALCIGLERGTPLADILRAQAQDIREDRRRRLIEIGGRREVMMLVPVVFLILPPVVLFALFPALVSLDLLVP